MEIKEGEQTQLRNRMRDSWHGDLETVELEKNHTLNKTQFLTENTNKKGKTTKL